MDSEEHKAAPETKIPIQFDMSPEQPVQTTDPGPAQPEEPIAEVPSLAEQPVEEPEHRVPEVPAQPAEQTLTEAEQHHQEAPTHAEMATPPEQPVEHQPLPGKSRKTLMLIGIGVIVVVIVAAVVLLAGGNKKPKPSNSQPAVVLPVQYTDPQTGFKIMRPAGWDNIAPAVGSGDSVEFQDPQADPINASASYRPIITISDAPAHGSSLAQVVNNVNTSLAKQVPGYKSLGTTQETVGSTPATLLTYTYNLSSSSLTFPVTADELIVIKNDTGYILRGVSLSSNWTQHKTVIENSLLSFQPK